MMDIELAYSDPSTNYAANTLSKSGINIQDKFPTDLVSIEEQVLKINGQIMGKIIPIGQQNIRLEVSLSDEGYSLLELMSHPMEIQVEYRIEGHLHPLSQTVTIEINPRLLAQLDMKNLLQSFSVLENTSMQDVIKLSSQIDPLREDEGVLNRVEVVLHFQFEDHSVFQGPFRLSSAGTLASGQVIKFLKYSDDFSINVSGQAIYEDGRRDIIDFETSDQIIVIDENKLK